MQVRSGLFALATRLVGPNTLVQAAIPDLLRNTPRSFYDHSIQVCQVCRVPSSSVACGFLSSPSPLPL